MEGFDIMLEKVFKLRENHTTVKTEVLAGITTFMTMAYILAVNPNVLSAAGMDRGAVFTAVSYTHLDICVKCWKRKAQRLSHSVLLRQNRYIQKLLKRW